MKREDLFLAIGEVEESRLARSEHMSASNVTILEGKTMEQTATKRPRGRTIRNLLVAAVIVAMLASLTFVLAGNNQPGDQAVVYEPFRPGVFESEEEFLNAIFGLTGYDHVAESLVCDCPDPNNHRELHKYEYTPSTDRVALNEEVAETLKSYITHVGKTMSWNGYTLTVDSMFFDEKTGFCAFAYTFESEHGDLDLDVSPQGIINNYYFTPFAGGSYVVVDKSTDSKVTAIGVTLGAEEGDFFEIEFNTVVEAGMTLEALTAVIVDLEEKGEDSEYSQWWDALERCPDTMQIRIGSPDDLDSITIDAGSVEVLMTPVGMLYKGVDSYDEEVDRDHSVSIRFADGTEYVVHENPAWQYAAMYGAAENFLTMGVNMHSEYTRYAFNRLVDLEEVVSVVLDGTEYFVE